MRNKQTVRFNYKGLALRRFRERNSHTETELAVRFILNDTNQNVWIPKRHLDNTGRLIPGENVDYVFAGMNDRKKQLAGFRVMFERIEDNDFDYEDDYSEEY